MHDVQRLFKNGFSVCTVILLLILAGCGTSGQDSTSSGKSTESTKSVVPASAENPVVTITMEDESIIELELYYDKAPNTVNNFIALVEKGFYNGLTFHRVIPDFMIQGGDPNGNGTGDPGYAIKGEFSGNGVENDLKHERGIVSMARSQMPDSAGSQFFIMVADSPNLDGQYAAFGKVISGMNVVDKIVSVERDKSDKPLKDVLMKKVTVDTKGVDYPKPEKVKD